MGNITDFTLHILTECDDAQNSNLQTLLVTWTNRYSFSKQSNRRVTAATVTVQVTKTSNCNKWNHIRKGINTKI